MPAVPLAWRLRARKLHTSLPLKAPAMSEVGRLLSLVQTYPAVLGVLNSKRCPNPIRRMGTAKLQVQSSSRLLSLGTRAQHEIFIGPFGQISAELPKKLASPYRPPLEALPKTSECIVFLNPTQGSENSASARLGIVVQSSRSLAPRSQLWDQLTLAGHQARPEIPEP